MFVLETQLPDGTWSTIDQDATYAVIKDKKSAVLTIRDEVFGTPENPSSDVPVPRVRVRNADIYPTAADLDEDEATIAAFDDGEDDYEGEDFETVFEHDHSMDY